MKKFCFVLDSNLGKLTKYLRFAGFDCINARHLSESAIFTLCQNEKRIFLTRKIKVPPQYQHIKVLKINSDQINEQLKEVFSHIKISKEHFSVSSLCIRCNRTLETLDEQLIPEELKVSSSKFKYCPYCKKMYWEGTHYQKMLSVISEL